MAGMTTKLHLNATEPGDYTGQSANISGEGFADMKFIARASSQADFNNWVKTVKQSGNQLTTMSYKELAKQSKDNPVTVYADSEDELFDSIIMKYMMPADASHDTASPNTATMDHSEHMNHSEMESH